MTRLGPVLAAAMLALLGGGAVAHDYRLGGIAIEHPFARATPPVARTGAGYLRLSNAGAEEDRLVAASGAASERIEIHETTLTDGVARMREVEGGVAIPPGATVAFTPGGQYHLMLVGLREPLTEGMRVPVVLTFERAGEIEVELAVEAARPGEDDAHSGH